MRWNALIFMRPPSLRSPELPVSVHRTSGLRMVSIPRGPATVASAARGALCCPRAAGPPESAMSGARREPVLMRIDLHTHIVPEQWEDFAGRYGGGRWPRLVRRDACHAAIMTGDA